LATVSEQEIASFLAGDPTSFLEHLGTLMDKDAYDEAFGYLQSYLPYLDEIAWPKNELSPAGPWVNWLFAVCVFKLNVGQVHDLPNYMQWFFSGGVVGHYPPAWAANVVADFVMMFVDNESISLDDAIDILGWAIDFGATDRDGALALLRVKSGSSLWIDDLIVESYFSPETVEQGEIANIVFLFIKEQLRDKKITRKLLQELIEYLINEPRLVDPVNTANLQWLALASGSKSIVEKVYSVFQERESMLRTNFSSVELSNCITNHAHIAAVLEFNVELEKYFEEAIELGNSEASLLFASISYVQNAKLQKHVRAELASNRKSTEELHSQVFESSDSKLLEVMQARLESPDDPMDSLKIFRQAKKLLLGLL
jgi:hypothetical protein